MWTKKPWRRARSKDLIYEPTLSLSTVLFQVLRQERRRAEKVGPLKNLYRKMASVFRFSDHPPLPLP